jgi:hypothetical protein
MNPHFNKRAPDDLERGELKDEPESILPLYRCRIDIAGSGNCVFAVIFEPI